MVTGYKAILQFEIGLNGKDFIDVIHQARGLAKHIRTSLEKNIPVTSHDAFIKGLFIEDDIKEDSL